MSLPFGSAPASDKNIITSDVTNNNVSITKHGFAPKAPNDATKFLDGTGAYSTPASGGAANAVTMIAHSETQVTVAGGGFDGDLVNFTLPTNLVAGDRIRIHIVFNWFELAGEAYNYPPRFKTYLGSTLLFDTGNFWFPANTPGNVYPKPGHIDAEIIVKATGGSPEQLYSHDGYLQRYDGITAPTDSFMTQPSNGTASTENLGAGKAFRFTANNYIDDADNYYVTRESYTVIKLSAS